MLLALLGGSLLIIPLRTALVKNFFRLSENFFPDPGSLPGVSLERPANITPNVPLVNSFLRIFDLFLLALNIVVPCRA